MKQALAFMRHNPALCASGLVITLLAAAAVCAPLIAPFDPLAINLDSVKQGPGSTHLFGTDTLGRDIFSRVVFGARTSLAIGLSATALSLVIGLLAGMLGGYVGGAFDTCITMITDLFLAFPSLLLAIAISVLLPPGLLSVTLALCLVGWASFARLFRAMTISLKERSFVEAARAMGCSHLRIMARHLLPHCLPVVMIAATIKVGGFILAESALSFLGLGIQPPEPTWGAMISLHRNYLPSAGWMVVFPGCAIALTVFAFNIFGDCLRDKLDPTLRV
ncbi:MAG: ABC transporter permease [Deltaproteobacteria bacterium]|nr:ABC transporter permease [Deltaproteobacteria bacterium]